MDRNDPKFNSEMYEKMNILMEAGYEVEDKLDELLANLYDLKREFRKGKVDA